MEEMKKHIEDGSFAGGAEKMNEKSVKENNHVARAVTKPRDIVRLLYTYMKIYWIGVTPICLVARKASVSKNSLDRPHYVSETFFPLPEQRGEAP